MAIAPFHAQRGRAVLDTRAWLLIRLLAVLLDPRLEVGLGRWTGTGFDGDRPDAHLDVLGLVQERVSGG